MRNLKTLTEQQAQWVAVLVCALWMLHPYMVSTTLYVVQRMAQLATLFSLAGIVLYLYARLLIPTKPLRAYILMALGVGAGTVLATYSKENGALLPLLILTIEFCLPKDSSKPAWQWRAVCLWLPSIALALLLARYINFTDNPWPNRNFNQIERLLTEGRIVSEYLFYLFVPRIEGNGLYQDGYVISKSLFSPISTFWSLVFLTTLLTSAFVVRKIAPVVAMAILFFFAAHLMESTVIGLELYFEHRNYLAALFLFLPIAYYAVVFFKRSTLVPISVAALLVMLSGMTLARASLWGDTDKLELFWAQTATGSPRAINSLAAQYNSIGDYEYALRFVQDAGERLPDSSFLTIRILLQKIYMGIAKEPDFLDAASKLEKQPFDAQTVMGLRVITNTLVATKHEQYAQSMLMLLAELQNNPRYTHSSVFKRVVPYLQARLYVLLGQQSNAYAYYSDAIKRYKSTSSSLQMVSELAVAGYLEEALELLDQAQVIFADEPDKSLDRSRKTYEEEFVYLRQTLKQEISERK